MLFLCELACSMIDYNIELKNVLTISKKYFFDRVLFLTSLGGRYGTISGLSENSLYKFFTDNSGKFPMFTGLSVCKGQSFFSEDKIIRIHSFVNYSYGGVQSFRIQYYLEIISQLTCRLFRKQLAKSLLDLNDCSICCTLYYFKIVLAGCPALYYLGSS